MKLSLAATTLVLVFVATAAHGDEPVADLGIRAPEGFEVTLFADDDLAHDIYSMTLDPQGRIVVAGRGYVKTLHDDDGDGRADRATLFSDRPQDGAHGMVFVGNDLIATGDNQLLKLEDKDANGVADGRPIPLALVNTPEHGANGLVQGPDGWIYLIAGNDAGIGAQFARTKTSPVSKPQAGCVVRFSPDFKTSEIFAHGFRNPYDLAFNENGQLFTVDSDGERDHYLPWYTPTRLYDIQQGMHHGWVQQGWTRSWARPASYFDNVPRLVEIGRGSPTGVECYRHYAFPQRYRGSIFSCCWTLGTVYHFPLTREGSAEFAESPEKGRRFHLPSSVAMLGSSYESQKEVFLQTTGEIGFAPVDLAVGPQGEMYVAIGGRGTRGSVFCVRFTGKLNDKEQPPKAETELDQVLNAPQPLAAWSRAKWVPLAKKLGKDALPKAATDSERPASQRIRAIESLHEIGEAPPRVANIDWFLSPHVADFIARSAWAYGMSDDKDLHDKVREWMTSIGEPLIERAVWETPIVPHALPEDVGRLDDRGDPFARDVDLRRDPPEEDGDKKDEPDPKPEAVELSSWWLRLSADDRRVQHARLLRLGGLPARQRPKLGEKASPEEQLAFLKLEALAGRIAPNQMADVLAVWNNGFKQESHKLVFDDRPSLTLWSNGFSTPAKIDCLRLMQLCLGDMPVTPLKPEVYAGYSASKPEAVDAELRLHAAKLLAKIFPTNDAELNRELARTLCMLEVDQEISPSLLRNIAKQPSLRSSAPDDIHYLIVLSRLSGERSAEVTKASAGALAFLPFKLLIHNQIPSRNWPLRVGEVFGELCQHDPLLAESLANHREFSLPQHAMFAMLMPEKERSIAARRLLEKSKHWNEETLWTPELVRLVAELGDAESLEAVRAQWHDFSLRDVILETLAAKPDAAHRTLYFEALALPDAGSVARAAAAIAALDAPGTAEEIALVMSALRQQCNVPESREARAALAHSLKAMTGEEIEVAEPEPAGTGGTPVPLTYIAAANKPWFDWFAKAHPELSKQLDAAAALDGVDLAERVAKIDWAAGDAERGATVYAARACAKCHSGASRLGPDLTGVTGRWSHEDLLREIVEPNRNVAPQYHTTRLITRDGKVYQGVLVYESPEGTLVQTAGDTTLRIAGDEIVRVTKTTQSLMPSGLLSGLGDGEIADLVAYLKTLAPSRTP